MDGCKERTSVHLKDFRHRSPENEPLGVSLRNLPSAPRHRRSQGPKVLSGSPQLKLPVLCKEPHFFWGPALPQWRPEVAGRFAGSSLTGVREHWYRDKSDLPLRAQHAVHKETIQSIPGQQTVLPEIIGPCFSTPSAEKELSPQQAQLGRCSLSLGLAAVL